MLYAACRSGGPRPIGAVACELIRWVLADVCTSAWHRIGPELHTAAADVASPSVAVVSSVAEESFDRLASSRAHEGTSPSSTPRVSLEMLANISKLDAKCLEVCMCNQEVITTRATFIPLHPIHPLLAYLTPCHPPRRDCEPGPTMPHGGRPIRTGNQDREAGDRDAQGPGDAQGQDDRPGSARIAQGPA